MSITYFPRGVRFTRMGGTATNAAGAFTVSTTWIHEGCADNTEIDPVDKPVFGHPRNSFLARNISR